MTSESVTVLGLGVMGSALARAFAAAGHPTTAWNRTQGRAPDLTTVTRTETVAEAIEASPLVVVCLLHYDVAYEALRGAEDRLAGKTLVNLCNGTPAQARAMAVWAAGHGARYLDGGIMAVPPMIGGPDAMTLYSGDPDAFAEHQDTFGALGTALHLGADPGIAALHDIALLSGMYGMFAGFLHAVGLVRPEGIKATELMTLLEPMLRAMLPSLTKNAEQIDSGDYDSEVTSPLAMQLAAFGNFLDSARDQGIRPDLLTGIHTLMSDAVDAGHGNHDIAALIEVINR